ncbi:MAG: Hsp20/alpha crystallin family protein [Deltaproteobacteria bacterium]|nr:Hsp20/alpha crystallin family protein [Candidatus Anaeroferrophillacea bacterium]
MLVRIWREAGLPEGEAELQPPLEVIEGPGGYRLLIALPGVDHELIRIEVLERVLTVSGERRRPALEDEERLVMTNQEYGRFRRRLRLPAEADPEKISAGFSHGMLEISVGRTASPPARRIPVEIMAVPERGVPAEIGGGE